MMLTAVIIDDEPRGRHALREKLKDYCPGVGVAGEASGGEEGLRMIQELNPEIVFLDIEMPRMNGFEMLQRLPYKNFHLIFTTAYDQYAIRAIKFAAFDYLLKPVDIEELKQAMERVKKEKNTNTSGRLEVLEHNLLRKDTLGKIAISTLEGVLFLNLSDIVHIEAQSNYSIFHFNGRPKLTASKTLKEIEELLPAANFFRTHHSYIINLQYIKRYIKGDGGQVEMQNGHFVDVARRKKESFLKVIGY